MANWKSRLETLLSMLEPVELFGDMLSEYMEKAEVPGQELASLLYVVPATVSQWKHGKRLPDAEILYPLSQALMLNEEEMYVLVNAYRLDQTMRSICDFIRGVLQSFEQVETGLTEEQKNAKARQVSGVVKAILRE